MYANPARLASSLLLLAAAAPLVTAQTLQLGAHDMLALDDVEITPDQHYAVVRENNALHFARVYDLVTGTLAATVPAAPDFLMGECLDGVAVTNTRAVVIGNLLQILDLTNLASPVLATHRVGYHARDVAITPDGTLAVVRGGVSIPGNTGGLFVYDLASGAQLFQRAGEPPPYPPTGFSFEVDACDVSGRNAVFTSFLGPASSPRTRVTVVTLRPVGGGPPAVAFETGGPGGADLVGAPHDIALTPNGRYAVVRSEFEIGVYELTGAAGPHQLFVAQPTDAPGPFDDSAMDSVEVTNDRIATISRNTNVLIPGGTQLDVLTFAGAHHHARMAGEPHDLALTPDGTRVLVRTNEGLSLFQIGTLPPLAELPTVAHATSPSAGTYYFGGLDSIACTNEFAVTLTQPASLSSTQVWFWNLGAGGLGFLAQRMVSGSRPIDLAITPDGKKVVVSGNAAADVYHLATGTQTFDRHEVGPNPYYQWCDGVAVRNEKAVAVGQFGPQNGWITLIDMTPFATNYCLSTLNSSGRAAIASAMGTASVSANSLRLLVEGAPASARGRFYYGATQQMVPFGDGYQCVGGALYGLRLLDTNAAGAGALQVNYVTQTIPGGIITPGSTWNFQFVFFDPLAPGIGINSSDAISIPFGP